MKLNWFSPLPPARTDIAHYTRRVLKALAACAVEVTLWTDQSQWDATLEAHARVRTYQLAKASPLELKAFWAELNRADMTIYHLGNDPKFHGTIWQVSQLHPGIVVLHDFRLQHLFAGLYLDKWRDPEAYFTQMEFYYGEAGRRAGREFYEKAMESDAALYIDEMARRYPLTLLALENALGALVHNREAYDALNSENLCPVLYTPLPFDAKPDASLAHLTKTNLRSTRNPCKLLVFGYLGQNRRLEALLQALAGLTEKERFRLDIYGQVADERGVRQTIKALGLKRLVRLHGFVAEAELEAALRSAHLAINLRFPTMGEASGSQLRIWAHALPTLVTSVGWYATLSPEAVSFVRPAHEIADIQMHLRDLLARPAHFAQMGLMGRELLKHHHAPEDFAQAVLELVESAGRFRSLSAARALAMRSGVLMGRWLALSAEERARLEVFAKKQALSYRSVEGKLAMNRRLSLLQHAISLNSWRRLLRRLTH
jgi:glycosyltransferase involved in cell wall biosynthesis